MIIVKTQDTFTGNTMFANTPILIRKLKLNEKEKDSRSRKRLGFHVYLSRYFYDFLKLPLVQQHNYAYVEFGHRLGGYRLDDSSIDSTSSVWQEKVHHTLVHKFACNRWRYVLSVGEKNAWNNRARILNRKKLAGKFLRLPWSDTETASNNSGRSNNNTGDMTTTNVLESLSYEWRELVVFLKRCITTRPRALLFDKYIKLGYEKIYVGSQTYRDVKLSYLVELSLFGRDFVLMHPSEIIMKTKTQVLFHISNQKRMKELFSKEDMNATEFKMGNNKNKYIQTCCGKVSLTYRNKSIIGYIIDVSQGRWKILLANNKFIHKAPLIFDSEKKDYIYPTNGQYIIDEYWPIRILLSFKGRGVRFTFNRIAYKIIRSDQYKLLHNCSS